MVFGFGNKGKIDIQLDKLNYKYGETIKGKVILELEKPVKARELRITFIGEKEEKRWVRSGGHRHRKTERTIIHNFKLVLDGEKEYSDKKEYPFEIRIPEKPKEEKIEGFLGTVIKVLNTLNQRQTKIEWHLTATLDIPMGIDINKKINVNVIDE